MLTTSPTRSGGRHAAALLLAILAACTNTPAPRAQPTASPSPRSTQGDHWPRPPAFPSVFPQHGGDLLEYEEPDFTVTASVTPNAALLVGDQIAIRLSIRNNTNTRRENGPANTRLFAFAVTGGAALMKVIKKPPEATISESCFEYDARCTVAELGIRFGLGPHERLDAEYVLQIIDMECRGGGDFIGQITLGLGGAVKHGPNAYRILLWFSNDPEDFAPTASKVQSSPRRPVKPCKSQSVPAPLSPNAG